MHTWSMKIVNKKVVATQVVKVVCLTLNGYWCTEIYRIGKYFLGITLIKVYAIAQFNSSELGCMSVKVIERMGFLKTCF